MGYKPFCFCFCAPHTVVTVTTSATCMAVTSITTTPAITTLSPSDLAQYARQSNLKVKSVRVQKGHITFPPG